MKNAVVLVAPSGSPAAGVEETLGHLGRRPVETLVHDRPEDGRYYLSPATVERVEGVLKETDASGVVVDGEMHPGQVVDLEDRLGVETRDRRSLVWEHFAAANPAAESRFALRRRRIERRAVASRQRRQPSSTPAGASGRLEDLERRCQDLRAELEARQTAARERIRRGHTDVDAHVLAVRRADAGATTGGAALTGEPVPSGLRPRQPRTTVTTIKAHTVAVTVLPDIPGNEPLPTWVTAVVPGIEHAISRADVVVGAPQRFLGHITDTDTPTVATDEDTSILETVAEQLPAVRVALELPYTDGAHTLVSWLHDNIVVREISYTDSIRVHCTAPVDARAEIVRRAEATGGACLETTANPE